MREPNRNSVIRAINECAGDVESFINRYASGRNPKAHYLRHEGKLYPLKAIWAAAHNPSIHTRNFKTDVAIRGLSNLGFEVISDDKINNIQEMHNYDDKLDELLSANFIEGERILREVMLFKRNRELVRRAINKHGTTCVVCGFNFGDAYGDLGVDYIEVHHISPLCESDGIDFNNNVDDVTVLCANCHRMIHHKRPALTLEELRNALTSSYRRRRRVL
ncbi:HNH endonuclease [Blastochloris sulfoviridis]|uniref:HNH nuclease domain-containing protein n=1 Tax=Blastochloris sulfoviridis TaxID=50712 RepID=A0A5M6HLI8_9HYPH|nr:HNH endonuclease [Blastochloris sulfoviridis]KAA5596727.1 hypothetical protein F1193_15475 [Blastochloris sulfoviridis]